MNTDDGTHDIAPEGTPVRGIGYTYIADGRAELERQRDYEIRSQALSDAVKIDGPQGASRVLRTAAQFYEFLTGASAADAD